MLLHKKNTLWNISLETASVSEVVKLWVASLRHLWRLPGITEISQCLAFIICQTSSLGGGAFQMRNYFMPFWRLVYVEILLVPLAESLRWNNGCCFWDAGYLAVNIVNSSPRSSITAVYVTHDLFHPLFADRIPTLMPTSYWKLQSNWLKLANVTLKRSTKQHGILKWGFRTLSEE